MLGVLAVVVLVVGTIGAGVSVTDNQALDESHDPIVVKEMVQGSDVRGNHGARLD